MQNFDRAFDYLRQAVSDGAAPCAAAAVGIRSTSIRTDIYGNAAIYPSIVPADLSTRFDMASMTKIMSTTMVALRFLEMKRLNLQDKISDYFENAGAFSAVTVFQLLTHTGGFVPYLDLAHLCQNKEDVLTAIFASAPICTPGTQVFYSCMGFIVLGKILEKIGGKPLDQLADTLVFTPLHMTHTGYRPSGTNFASTEMSEGRYLNGTVHDENARFLGGISGNAGVFSDLHDTEIFASMLASDGFHDGRSFLQPSTLHMAAQSYTDGMDQRRGLGFHLQSSGSFHGKLALPQCYGHTGFTGTSLVIDPKTGLYIVLLSNRVHPSRENTQFLEVRRTFHELVMQDFSSGDFADLI